MMKYRKRLSLPRGGHGEFRQLRVMENRFHECGEHARGGMGLFRQHQLEGGRCPYRGRHGSCWSLGRDFIDASGEDDSGM